MPTTRASHHSTPHHKAAPKRAPSASARTATDAVKLLVTDHKEVKALFKAYEKLVKDQANGDEKQAIAHKICTLLTVHATIEEEIFYPAARDALPEADLVDEATVEHATAKDLIAQIESMSPGDDLYDAKVKVLNEYIDHHVKEEETELFPKVQKTKVDLDELGSELSSRKEELLAELGEDATA
jgi:hemerythrin-like domain-containing protein